jgi:glutathione S-transferase
MRLYIAHDTCSRAAQLVANELGLDLELVHFDVVGKSTSNGEEYSTINPMLYVPALRLDTDTKDFLAETITIISYLADLYPDAGLIPRHGTLERAKVDQMLVFVATEIAQKHIPLMRKLMTEEGLRFNTNKLLQAYRQLDDTLADGRLYLLADRLTVADAYVWATLWHKRSGVDIGHLQNLMGWIERMGKHPAAVKTLQDEAEIVALHRRQIEANKN